MIPIFTIILPPWDFSSTYPWRYQTWVGRMAAEAIVYITFNLGLGFWRVADAVMMVLLPIGILRLGCKYGRLYGIYCVLNEYQERVDVGTEQHNSGELNVWRNLWKKRPVSGFTCEWISVDECHDIGIFCGLGEWFHIYTWTFTAGVWAMMPLQILCLIQGVSNRQLIYALPCSVIAAMSIEQMGAVLLAFEGLSI